MSKKSWLPTVKGTELFPDAIRPPTKLVVKDVVPGTELYDAVAAEYSGRLRQFHAKAQQTHSLSVNQITKLRQQFGDDEARATYLNQFGNETLTLEVSRSKLGELEEKVGKEDWWIWALIELDIPHVNIQTDVVKAYLKAQRTAPRPGEAGLKYEGYAYNEADTPTFEIDWSDGLNPFVISWAPHTDPDVTIAIGTDVTQKATLLVDMRRFPKTPVSIKLYGYLLMGGDNVDHFYGWGRNMTPTLVNQTIHDLGFVSFPTGWDYVGQEHVFRYEATGNDPFEALSPEFVYFDEPGVVLNEFTEFWDRAPSMIQTPAGSDYVEVEYHAESNLPTRWHGWSYFNNYFGPGHAGIVENDYTWDIYELHTTPFVLAPETTRIADVRGIGGFDWMDWQTKVAHSDDTGFEYATWILAEQDVKTIHVGNATIHTNYDADFESHYAHIGTVTIDPLHKAIGFQPP